MTLRCPRMSFYVPEWPNNDPECPRMTQNDPECPHISQERSSEVFKRQSRADQDAKKTAKSIFLYSKSKGILYVLFILVVFIRKSF